MAQQGFVNLDLICEWMDANLEFDVNSVSNGVGMYPRMEQLSCAIHQWIEGNNTPSGYINGMLEPWQVTICFCKKKW